MVLNKYQKINQLKINLIYLILVYLKMEGDDLGDLNELRRQLRAMGIGQSDDVDQLIGQLEGLKMRQPQLKALIELPRREVDVSGYMVLMFRDLRGGELRYELTNDHVNGLSAMLLVIDEGTTVYSIDDIRIYRLSPGVEWVAFNPIEYINQPNNLTMIEMFDVADPIREYRNIEEFLSSVESRRSPYSRQRAMISSKYIGLLSWGSVSMLVQFNTMNFIEMVVNVCNWFNENWRLHIGYIYQVNRPHQGGVSFTPISIN